MSLYLTWLLLSLLIASILRLMQYSKTYGILFSLGHAFLDILVVANPLTYLFANLSLRVDSLLLFGILASIYLLVKYIFLVRNSDFKYGFPMVDIALFAVCIVLQDSIGYIQKLLELN